MRCPTPGEVRFWAVAEALLDEPGITRSTMMGFACLRIDGKFFATCDHRSGALVVKLSEDRVDGLVASGRAESFAPAGRPFREWASIPAERSRDVAPPLDRGARLRGRARGATQACTDAAGHERVSVSSVAASTESGRPWQGSAR